MSLLGGGLVLLLAVFVLRRALRLDSEGGVPPAYHRLPAEHRAVCAAVEKEVKTQLDMLSVVLNDAIEERNTGRPHIAWHLVKLAGSQWEQATENLALLLEVLRKNVDSALVPVAYKGPVTHRFKSHTVADYLRMHEFLVQLVFRSKLRFQLQVEMLRRAGNALSKEFQRTCRYGDMTEDQSPEVWQRLDADLHDLDVLSKEAMLALRACLVRLPEPALESLRRDLEPVLRRGVRAASVSAGK